MPQIKTSVTVSRARMAVHALIESTRTSVTVLQVILDEVVTEVNITESCNVSMYHITHTVSTKVL